MMPYLYADIPGWFDGDYLKLYHDMVLELPNQATVIEIGCWKGKSACFLLEMIKEVGKNIKPLFIDKFTGDEYGINGNIGADLDNFKKNLYDRGFDESTFDVMATDSIEYGQYARNNWDFVMLDGCHTTDYVRKEIETWKRKTKILAGHDYPDQGINAIVKELLPEHENRGSCYLWRKQCV